MLQILEFIFQDFWHWLGTVIIIGVITEEVRCMFQIVISSYKNSKE